MLLAGALLVLTFPDANLEFLAWFGLVPGLVLIVRSPTAREGGIRAWWLGAGYLIAALYWLAPEIGPGVLLVAAVVGVLWVPFGVAAWKLLRPPVTWPRALAALVVVPSCWLLTEWLRSWQALGGPWAVYGVSQWQHPAVLALAAVGGVWLISIALVLANVAIVLAIESLRWACSPPWPAWAPARWRSRSRRPVRPSGRSRSPWFSRASSTTRCSGWTRPSG
jgi:apolipoprotein N-acyltransferase